MSDSPRTWRQEIERMLAEIAADPQAKLLRVPSVDGALSFAQQPPVGVLAPSLTTGERYLLQAHRDELAFLLRERCVMAFYSAPEADQRWEKSLSAERSVVIPSERDWRQRATDVSGCDIDRPHSDAATDALTQCIVGGPRAALSYEQLALASLRVMPSECAQMYVALHFIDEGRPRQARAAMHALRESTMSELMASMCWQNIAFAFQGEGRRDDALKAYRSAALACGSRVVPALFWLSTAASVGDVAQVSEAARVADERIPVGHRSDRSDRWVALTLRRAVRGNSSASLRGAMSKVLDDCGETTARILNAYLS